MAQCGVVNEVPTLVLASASPRRKQILRQLGLAPIIAASDVDETPKPDESAASLVARLARAKATAGWQASSDLGQRLVIAADTVVELEGRTLGKPRDNDEAKTMLSDLSGRDHSVVTGVAVAAAGPTILETVERTKVTFRTLSEADIAWYVASGEPADKAGAYGIQGLGALLVDKVDGSYLNVVGLPVTALDELIRRTGFALRQFAADNRAES